MRKAIAAGGLATVLLVTSVTAAAAWDDRYDRDGYRGPGPVLGFVGDVFAGAFKIATAPLALLADLGRDARGGPHYRHYHDEEGAYANSVEEARAYYGAGARYYGPPPGHFHYDGR